MKKWLITIGLLAFATILGTAITVGVFSDPWGSPKYGLGLCAFVAVGHLVLCLGYYLTGETVVEDVVKSVCFVFCGVVICGLPNKLAALHIFGWLAISAAVSALVVNQTLKCLIGEYYDPNSEENQKISKNSPDEISSTEENPYE